MAFQASNHYKTLVSDLAAYKQEQVEEEKDHWVFIMADNRNGVAKKNPYTLGFTEQVKALTACQVQMRLQDKFQIILSYLLNLWVVFIVGIVYPDMLLTGAGGSTQVILPFIGPLMMAFDL